MTPSLQADAIKRRQYLLMGGVALLVVGAAAIGVAVTSGGKPVMGGPVKPRTVPIMAPGAQVEPKDTWIATAGAEIRGLTEKNKALDNQNRDMLDRLKKLEADKSRPGGSVDGTSSAGPINTAVPSLPVGANPAASLPTSGQRFLNSNATGSRPGRRRSHRPGLMRGGRCPAASRPGSPARGW